MLIYVCMYGCLFVYYLAAAADAGEDRRVAESGAVLRIKRHVVGTAGMLHVLLYKHNHIQFKGGSSFVIHCQTCLVRLFPSICVPYNVNIFLFMFIITEKLKNRLHN